MNAIETLRDVITKLDRINVPVTLIEQIGIPIINANVQLKELHNYIYNETNKEENEKKDDPEIAIEVVPEEEAHENEDEQQNV